VQLKLMSQKILSIFRSDLIDLLSMRSAEIYTHLISDLEIWLARVVFILNSIRFFIIFGESVFQLKSILVVMVVQ